MEENCKEKKSFMSESDEIFADENDFKNFFLSTEDQKRSFECDICFKSFSTKANLGVHVTSVHEGKRPFK